MVPEKKPINSPEEVVIDTEDTVTQTLTEEQVTAISNEQEEVKDVEGSTVLTHNNGMEQDAKKVKPLNERTLRSIIALGVALVLLITGVIVVPFLPEKAEDSQSIGSTNISVVKRKTDDIAKIEIDGTEGKLSFSSAVKKTEDSNGEVTESYVWSLDGYDPELIANSSVNAAADSVATMYATRIMETSLSKKALYGLDKPSITVNVTAREGENFTILLGDKAPDGSGYYACVTGSENIYLIPAGTVANFDTTPEDLANTVILSSPNVEDVVKKTDKKYFDESGALATFESIQLSGPKYGQTAVITPVTDNEFVEYSIDLGSYSRYADPDVVDDMFSIMTNGLVAIDTYVLEPTAADIKAYKLDNPEINIVIKYGSLSTRLKATMYDKTNRYYSVMVDDRNAIYAVTADALAMLDYGTTDYYYQFVFQEFIYEFSNINIEIPGKGKNYSFDIKHNTSNDTFTAKSNGKEIDDSLLSAYYQYFLVLAPKVQSSYSANGPVALKATFTYKKSEKGVRVLEFVKQSERRYVLKIDGNAMGIVNAPDLDHLIVYAEYVMTNQGIPDPA